MQRSYLTHGSFINRQTTRRGFLRLGWRGLVGVVTLPLLAGCAIAQEKQRFAVQMQGPSPTIFTPGSLIIPHGTTVVWQNTDIYPHTVTCDPSLAQQQGGGVYALLPKEAEPWDSGDLYTGQMWSHTFTTLGQYIYFSRRDESGEMIGSITVT